MRRMAVASRSSSGHTRSASKIRRLPLEIAVVRSSKLGCPNVPNGWASIRTTSRDSSASARASVAPTRPPPQIATSGLCATGSIHPLLYCGRIFRRAGREHLVTRAGHRNIVLDAHTDVPPALRDALRAGGNVDAGLDGQRHSGLEHAPLLADLVVADVVHVHAEPVAGAMHEEAPVRALLDERRYLAFEDAELHQPMCDRADRGVVRLIPVIAGLRLGDGCVLRVQHDLVDGALLRREATVHRERAGDVRSVKLVLAPGIDQQQVAVG